MICDGLTPQRAAVPADVCVIGAGPVGLSLALELAHLGRRVLVLEAGGETPGPAPVPGVLTDSATHAPLHLCAAAALGGTSWWWGGRCVAMDALDHQPRAHVPGSGWPIPPEALAVHANRAADYLDCGSARFHDPHPDWQGLGPDVACSALERWSREPRLARRLRAAVAASARITLSLNAPVEALEIAGGQVRQVVVRGRAGARLALFPAQVVIAAGGLGSARLLALAQAHAPGLFGGAEGPLGRHYMGHLFGTIADLALNDPADAASLDFFRDASGAWVRRRFTLAPGAQADLGLRNVAFWADNPAFDDPSHRSGILSAIYLGLYFAPIGRMLLPEAIRLRHIGGGGRLRAHLANVARAPLATLGAATMILRQRHLQKPRRPGVLVRNPAGRYALTYHAEHTPDPDSRARLSARPMPDGARGLEIGLRFSAEDAGSVVRAHQVLDHALRAAGKGRLIYRVPEAGRSAAVLAQAQDGFHQQGLLRMGADPGTSVVTPECRVHGVANLHVASTAVLPTSGHANPTFAACCLGLRLAHHLAAGGGGGNA